MIRVLVAAAVVAASSTAHAFCGFYVAGSNQQLINDATQVVLMRAGTRTVLSMQNDYKGPPEAFAMVIPVPVVLHEGNVKTLSRDVFAHVEQMGAPRLVEYWEQDPCAPRVEDESVLKQLVAAQDRSNRAYAVDLSAVKVEARFDVGEYQIVILSATEATALETWLRTNHYNVAAGAAALLRPYVETGSKFFVAKVDPQKVKFENGHAALSPLRFHYDADEFSLPIRLGIANSAGTQDLTINILAPDQRYEVANYPNVTIPTNLDVKDGVKDHFGAFYAALFDRTLEKHPGAIVTEYAWAARTCDPCPGPVLEDADFMTLGADVLFGPAAQPVPALGGDSFVLTRLHARYGKDLANDLVFRQAMPIVGGREFQSGGKLEQGAHPDQQNNFQGRYAIRHPWTGPLRCEHPVRSRWGGPPGEIAAASGGVKSALGLAFAARGAVKLADSLLHDVPEIDLTVGASVTESPSDHVASGSEKPSGKSGKWTSKKTGCGCQTADRDEWLVPALVVGALLLVRKRRRRHL